MQYRTLGHTGLKVSAIGLGTNSFGGRADAQQTMDILKTAYEGGITLIDTANNYTGGHSETLIGEALHGVLKGKRHELVVATKAGLPTGSGPNDSGTSRFHLLREVEGSLTRLRTDYIDLLQVHTWDPRTPLDETLMTLDALVRSGKVRYIGCSNYRAWELMKALAVSDRHHLTRYQSIQLSYSLADRSLEREVLPLCRDQGIGLIAYFPLAGGILTGKYRGGAIPPGSRAEKAPAFFKDHLNDQYLSLAEEVADLAASLGLSTAQLALAWVLARQETTSAIAGATRGEQVLENLQASEATLESETLDALSRLSGGFYWHPPFGDYRLEDSP